MIKNLKMSPWQIWKTALLAVLAVGSSLVAFTQEPVYINGAAAVDRKFIFEKQQFTLSDTLSPYNNITVRADFDGDRKQETLVGFQAYTYDYDFKVPVAFIAIGKEIRGKLRFDLFMGNEYFKQIELQDIDSDGLPEILFWSEGGAHFLTLDIYKYQQGKLKKIFGNASACGIVFEKNQKKSTIKIGREQWGKVGWTYSSGDFVYEIWEWEDDEFKFNQDVSTSRPL